MGRIRRISVFLLFLLAIFVTGGIFSGISGAIDKYGEGFWPLVIRGILTVGLVVAAYFIMFGRDSSSAEINNVSRVENSLNRFPLESLRKNIMESFREDLISRIERIDAEDMKHYDGSERGIAFSNSLEDLKQVLKDQELSIMDMLKIKSFVEALERG